MIYLDNAATSFPKPRRVVEEQLRCMQSYCGNPGRGSHSLALAAAEKIYECREELASFFGSANPENVIFTMNTTMALNTAIKGLLRSGDHVLLSDMEHNAVFRPIYKLASEGAITYDVFETFPTNPTRTSEMICASILEKLRPRYDCICTTGYNFTNIFRRYPSIYLYSKFQLHIFSDTSQILYLS